MYITRGDKIELILPDFTDLKPDCTRYTSSYAHVYNVPIIELIKAIEQIDRQGNIKVLQRQCRHSRSEIRSLVNNK